MTGKLDVAIEPEVIDDVVAQRQPKYNVVLWDDNHHTFGFVIQMMRKLFGFQYEQGYEIADTVHNDGRAICLTTTLEHAELKRDQIHAFGRDESIPECVGAMWSTIEPVND